MKTLYITLSNSTSVRKTLNLIAKELSKKGVVIKGIVKNSINYQVSSLMKQDIENLIKNNVFEYAKIENVKSYPTTKFSSNGKDQEYYLTSLVTDDKLRIVINITKGTIQVI